MAAFDRIKSGISEMDTALDNIRLGDNVVWRVSDLSEFKLFMEPYIKQAVEGVISSYDMEYLSNSANREEVKKEVLEAIQKWLDSKVVYDISISDVKFG